MSHTVLVEFTCTPGVGPDVLKSLLEVLPDTRAYEGAELIEVYADDDNPDTIMVWEKWTARENQEGYLNWRIETGVLDQFMEVLAKEPRFVHLGQEAT